jgi:hypothetical protein
VVVGVVVVAPVVVVVVDVVGVVNGKLSVEPPVLCGGTAAGGLG